MTKKRGFLMLFIVSMAALFVSNAFAAEANWKRGRVYYRMVCTACHVKEAGGAISPSAKTIAQWKTYMDADKHAAGGKANPKVSYYTTKEYRESVKDTNKAAAKLLDIPDKDLFADVRAFVIHGAKDSDTPASCQ